MTTDSKSFNLRGIFLCLSLVFLFGCSNSEFTTEGCEGGDCENASLSYSWDISDWNDCDKACGGGTQTRTITCKDKQGNVNPDGRCPGKKEETSRMCNAQECTSDYSWLIGEWSDCSKTCGGGTRSRSVLCKYKDGSTENDTRCPGNKPVTTEECNKGVCAKTYSWKFSAWSDCSKTCGGGTQTRVVYCADEATDQTADASLCTGTKPSAIRNCPDNPCASTYKWSAGQWSACSKSCGGGTQTRSIMCERDDGQFVAASFCTGVKPGAQQSCNTDACVAQCVDSRNINANIESSSRLLDILLVVDDSGSMAADNLKLANRLKGFADDLTNRCKVNWQMCVTTTDADYFKGRPIKWVGHGSHILQEGTPDLEKKFVDTIKWIGSGWGNDEQGIKAMNLAVQDNYRSNCFRPNAALSVILISDEDERSVGGDQSLSQLQYRPLGALNQPDSFPKTVKETLGTKKKFNVNSIIVKDSWCRSEQNAQGAGAQSFYGTKYEALSNMTGGGIGSICSSSYTGHLNLFANQINRTMASINMQCAPVEAPTVTIRPEQPNQTIKVMNNQLIFTPVIQGPAEVTGSYCCEKR